MNIYLDDEIAPSFRSIAFHPGWSLRSLLAAVRSLARSAAPTHGPAKPDDSEIWAALRDAIFAALLPFPDAREKVAASIASVCKTFEAQTE